MMPLRKYPNGLLAALLGAALIVWRPPTSGRGRAAAGRCRRETRQSHLARPHPRQSRREYAADRRCHGAALGGSLDDLESVDLLIRAGANVNAKNDYSATPLSLACTNGNSAVVEKLLSAGANPNAPAASGETPLMRCARTGNVAAVKSLLARKADVSASDVTASCDRLPRQKGAIAQKHPAVAEALIQGGADIRARSKGGSFHAAAASLPAR